MIVQGFNALLGSVLASRAGNASTISRQRLPEVSANNADRITISDAARAQWANAQAQSESDAIGQRIAAIKAKPAVERAPGDREFLLEHDTRYAELVAKIQNSGNETLTADEVDYMQKAGGFVNTMAELSAGERAIYDELVSRGQGEAAQAMLLVGMARIGMGGQDVELPNGKHFDPRTTEITPDNLRQLFKLMFVDPSGKTDSQFEALARALETGADRTQAA